MYTPLIKSLLACPVKGLNLPALISPVSDFDYLERECALGWNAAEDSVAELIFTLRLNGVAVILPHELPEVLGM